MDEPRRSAASAGDLFDREARFWDEQEEAIQSLYARPHDWRFIPDLAETVIRPKTRYLRRLITAGGAKYASLLDVGCGNGWFCHAAAREGIRAYGVDISAKKIETARREAEEKGVADLCHFEAADVMDADLPEKVDLLTSHGSLHHFPDLDRQLPEIVERHLAPGGSMLFVEPNHEGMPPGLQTFVHRWAESRLFGRMLDTEFYMEVSRGGGAGKGSAEAESFNLRGESPAGLEFFGEEPDMGAILKRHYALVDEHYFHYAAGHLTNVFYVYMKSSLVRGLWRALLPLVVAIDDRLCRRPTRSRWAEEGLWLLKRRARAET